MIDEHLDLLELQEGMREEYAAYCLEFGLEQNEGWNPPADFDIALRNARDEPQGIGLPKGWVPASRFWLMREGKKLLGTIQIRHALTPWLEAEGGHIGYVIRPSERRRGYCTLMLQLALEKARVLGLKRVLITCDQRNIASAKVILKNGGVLENEVPSTMPGREVTQRYWIEL